MEQNDRDARNSHIHQTESLQESRQEKLGLTINDMAHDIARLKKSYLHLTANPLSGNSLY